MGRSELSQILGNRALLLLLHVPLCSLNAFAADPAAWSYVQRAGKIELQRSGQLITAVHFGRHWDKPFVHPLVTPSGIQLSRRWPVEPSEEKFKDHPWHRGLWWGHGDINGVDFWRELEVGKTGKLILSEAPRVDCRQDHCLVELVLWLQPPSGDPIGTVRERFTVWDQLPLRVIDAEISVAADRGRDLRFGDTEDGGFAVRLTDPLREDQGAQLVNSQGLKGTNQIWGKPARWVHYSAQLASGRCGVVMFDHPGNVRHPTRWHARGYGLCSANPFCLADFTGDRKQDGSYTLPGGQLLRLRYRVILHEGDLPAARIEELYTQFTNQD